MGTRMDTTTRREVKHMFTEEKTTGKILNWGDCPGVVRDPNRLAGAWTFGNTRLTLQPSLRTWLAAPPSRR